MKKLFTVAVVLCWSTTVHAEFPGSSFFKSMVDKVKSATQGTGAGSGQGDSSSGSQGDNPGSGQGDNQGGDTDSQTPWGARSPKEYMASLPAIPDSGCEADAEPIRLFKDKVARAAKTLNDEIDKRRQAIEKARGNNRDRMARTTLKNAGYGDIDPAELNKKRSKAEDDALADRILQEKYGITREQAKTISKSSTETKRAYMQNLSAQKEADDLTKSKSELEAEKDAKTTEKEFQAQMEKIIGIHKKFAAKVSELDQDKSAKALEKSTSRYEELRRKYATGGKVSCKELVAEAQKNYEQKEQFCSSHAPKYLKLLAEYRGAIEKNTLEYNRLDELLSAKQKNDIGVGLPEAAFGMSELSAISSYAGALGDAYKYDLTPRGEGRPDTDSCSSGMGVY
ncbi:hypothetical protein OR1_00341 [Geobacter sp. OR-1]|uniref:hypothetical protein n=1 Tax=Geobacter sp. OR-1 TaxID=1266765 RepID=UPI00054415E9|nr:hypothetical protein [Geobacter sp. OR-1]GAM08071.1 hypothetical protein OR1_00341 [Geobacter sp. OR-1]